MLLAADDAAMVEIVRFPDVNMPGMRLTADVMEWIHRCVREVSGASRSRLNASVRLEPTGRPLQFGPLEEIVSDGYLGLAVFGESVTPDIAFALPPESAAALIDFLLGDPTSAGTPARKFTRTDRAVLTVWAQWALRPAAASLSGSGPAATWTLCEPGWTRGATGEGFSASLNVRFASFETPGVLFVERDIARASIASGSRDAPATLAPRALHDAVVTATAVLGRSTVSLRQLRELEPGDVLLLDAQAGRDVLLRVGSAVRMRGRAGVKAGHMAVEIVSHDKPERTPSIAEESESDA